MKKAVLVALTFAFLIGGCVIGIGRHGNLLIIPTLPITVEVDDNNYYYQGGFYYWYQNDIWLYSDSREGPWHGLPRDRWPREIHRRGYDRDRDRDQRR